MDKRGLEKEFIVGAIIAIVGFGLIFANYAKAGERISKDSPEFACRASAVLRMKTTLGIGSDESAFKERIKTLPLVCRTQDKTLKGDEDKVAKQIADLMARCKYGFADGQYSHIFSKDKQGDYCFPCYTVVIEGNEKFEGITQEKLLETLNNEKNKQISGDLSYGGYLMGFNNVPGRLIIPKKIENKHTYIIYYSDPFAGEFSIPLKDKAIIAGAAGVAAKGLSLYLVPLVGPALGTFVGQPIAIISLSGATIKVSADIIQRYGLGEAPQFPGVYLSDANQIPLTYQANTFGGIFEGSLQECNVIDDFTGR